MGVFILIGGKKIKKKKKKNIFSKKLRMLSNSLKTYIWLKTDLIIVTSVVF